MKIFMTGWQGFIGSHLRETLKQHEISLLQNDLRDHAALFTTAAARDCN